MSDSRARKILWNVFKYVTLVLGAFVSLLPLVSCVITAFKSPEEYASTNVMTLPQSWGYFENFVKAWQPANMIVA
ncbi:MAG: carbohydrate ABC transporter permease, partial [Lachnospiraceae bacterium]|nr:carbohydrate ABC transporter permease [Lachnospiraceae bacterium]